MHDGSLQTLEQVVDYYDKGGNNNPNLDTEIRPLHLTAPENRRWSGFCMRSPNHIGRLRAEACGNAASCT